MNGTIIHDQTMSNVKPSAFDPIHEDNAADIILKIHRQPDLLNKINHKDFEMLVAELFKNIGFDVVLTPPVHDGGIDIIATKDTPIGTSRYIIECKNYSEGRPVGVAPVRSLLGVKYVNNANVAALVTNSTFTIGALEFASKIGAELQLIDRDRLLDLIRTAVQTNQQKQAASGISVN